jgi:hypothetical protein
MTRRALLFASLAFRLRADASAEVWTLFGWLSSALSEDRPNQFVEVLDPAMPGYETLRDNVTGLLREADVESSLEFLSNEGDEQNRTLEVDWILRITGKEGSAASARREEHVKCVAKKTGRRWRITLLEPAAFFAPAPPQ